MNNKNKIKLIVFTWDKNYPNEHKIIHKMFRNGLKRLHVRKPNYDFYALQNWLSKIDTTFLDRIVIHSHYLLVEKFDLAGYHLTETSRQKVNCKILTHAISTSFHNLNDWENNHINFEYSFLSPIRNSISKPNYNAAFDLTVLKRHLSHKQKPTYALGGMKPHNLIEMAEIGFDGIALLGAIWLHENPEKIIQSLDLKN